MNNNWLAPGYYPDFQCKADKCRHSCCKRWRIPVSRKEYNKLITMECSKRLNECIQNAFVVPETITEESYRYISFNWLGDCHMLKDGLCSLYLEKGEQYLPKICRIYPRSLKEVNGIRIASCSNSCEKVIEMIYENYCLDIKDFEMDNEAELFYSVDEKDSEQIKKIQDIIRDRNTTLSQSIIDVCSLINKDEFDKDYNSNKDPVDSALDLLKNISVNNDYLKELSDRLSARYKDRNNYYLESKEFENKYPNWMNFFERVINNSMIYVFFPFVDKRFDKTEAYKGLCCSYGLMRLVCVGVSHDSDNKDDLIDAIAFLYHVIEHTAFYYNVSILVENAAVMLKL